MNSSGGLEQLVFLAIALLYGIGVGIYRFVKWANRQIAGSATPNPIQQAIAEAQRQAQGTPQANMAQTLPERGLSSARPTLRQPQAGGPAVPVEATSEDFRRREQELQAESERAYAYFRQRAEALQAERAAAGNSIPQPAAQPNEPPLLVMTQPPAVPMGLLQTQDDLVRAFILREALGPPLSRRSSPK